MFVQKLSAKQLTPVSTPLQSTHFSRLPSLMLPFFASYPWAALYLETKDQSHGLFLDLPPQGFCFSLWRIIGERKMDRCLKITLMTIPYLFQNNFVHLLSVPMMTFNQCFLGSKLIDEKFWILVKYEIVLVYHLPLFSQSQS